MYKYTAAFTRDLDLCTLHVHVSATFFLDKTYTDCFLGPKKMILLTFFAYPSYAVAVLTPFIQNCFNLHVEQHNVLLNNSCSENTSIPAEDQQTITQSCIEIINNIDVCKLQTNALSVGSRDNQL